MAKSPKPTHIAQLVLLIASLSSCGQDKTSETKNNNTEKINPEKTSSVYYKTETIETLNGVTLTIRQLNAPSFATPHRTEVLADKQLITTIESDPIEQISVADINKDGNQELYIITRSMGSGSYAELFVFAQCGATNYQQINVNSTSDKDSSAYQGYAGHDAIWLEDNALFWEFPVYKDDDINNQPTGGTRTMKYRLVQRGQDCIISND